MSDTESGKSEQPAEVVVVEEQSSGDDPPMSEWSSLEVAVPEENKKKLLFAEGLYSPGSGELCANYFAMSDSNICIHPYYNYPAVDDPGIKEAILAPEKPIIYPDDGRKLYLTICDEMNACPVGLFHRNLINDEINLSYYGVNPSGVRPMAMALQFNKHVERFNLTDNFLNDDACFHLGQMLSSNVTLKELTLNGCRIGASGMLRLGYGLPVNCSLVALNLARNNIGEEGGAHFAKQIFDGSTLKQINLSNNQLGKGAALALAEALDYNNKLTHVDLSWNNFFHSPSTVKLIDALAESKVLKELNLAWNALEGERVAGAIKYLMLVPSLIVLDLSNNRFQGEAISLILANLFKAKKLDTLDLSFNPLTPEDALAAMEKMLKPRVKVEKLLLENVNVNKEFLTCLNKVMKMKSRKNFVVKYGKVLQDWSLAGPDPRELILQRADYLGNANKKRKVDVALFFLRMNKEFSKPIPIKELMDRIDEERVPLDEGLVSELSVIFPGSKAAKTKMVNLQLICDFIQRIWPERRLPPTPPPEPEPIQEPEPPPPPKGKAKGKKK